MSYLFQMENDRMQSTTKRAIIMAAGFATAAGANAAGQNCRWDSNAVGPGTTVRELMVYDGALHVGRTSDPRFMRWNGAGWQDLFTGLSSTVNAGASAVWDDGSGAALYVGGTFSFPANKFGRWDGTTLSDIGGAYFGTSTGQNITTMTVWNNAVYVGGAFSTTSTTSPSQFNYVARWDGMTMSGLNGGANGTVNALAVYQGQLHLFGAFTELGGIATGRGARWDGTTFQSVPFDIPSGAAISGALAWDDGSGEALYVHGSFATISGVTVNAVGRWDGTSWSGLGGGATQAGGSAAWIAAATLFNDGTGEKLYIGSHNTSPMAFAGGAPAARLAWWDGTSWGGAATGPNHTIFTLRQFDDPTGEPVLWVGGQFGTVASVSDAGIARWICDAPPPPPSCYANCDGSTVEPVLNVDDFTCFINEFAAAQNLPHQQQVEHYANCDSSLTAPVLNVDDFTCFINAFAQGCG